MTLHVHKMKTDAISIPVIAIRNLFSGTVVGNYLENFNYVLDTPKLH